MKKKTYPHIEEGSLCHRPSNCNLSNLCGLYKSLAPEIVSWFLRFAESLAPPANSRALSARASRSIFLAYDARFWSQLPRIESLTKTMKKGEKVQLGPQLFRGEGGGHSQKEGIFLISDNDIPIQSAACRWMLWTSDIVWSMSSLCT